MESNFFSPVTLSQTTISATEKQGNLNVYLTKPYRSGASITISCNAVTGGSNGNASTSDYGSVTQPLAWNANDMGTRSCVINIPDVDGIKKSPRTFTVRFTSSNADLVGPTSATVTIGDDDQGIMIIIILLH